MTWRITAMLVHALTVGLAGAVTVAPGRLPVLGHALPWLRYGDGARLVEDACAAADAPIVRLDAPFGGAPTYAVACPVLMREASTRRGCADRVDAAARAAAPPAGGGAAARSADGLTLGAGDAYAAARAVAARQLGGAAARARADAVAAAAARDVLSAAGWTADEPRRWPSLLAIARAPALATVFVP